MRLLIFNLMMSSLYAQTITGTGIQLRPPGGGSTPGILMWELKANGSNFVGLIGPNSIGTSFNIVLPNTPSAGPAGTYWNICADSTQILTWCSTTGAGSFIDTTTNQAGLAGDKTTNGAWIFNSSVQTQHLTPTVTNSYGLGSSSRFWYTGHINNLISWGGSLNVYDATGSTLHTTIDANGFTTDNSYGNLNSSVNAAGNALFTTVSAASGVTSGAFTVGTTLIVGTALNTPSISSTLIAPIAANVGAVGFSSSRFNEANFNYIRNYYPGGQVANEMLPSGDMRGYFTSGASSFILTYGTSAQLNLYDNTARYISFTPTTLVFSSTPAGIFLGADAGQFRTCLSTETIRGSRYVAGILVAGTCGI